MASRSLLSLVPDAAHLLDLQVEERAGVLLIHLNSYEGVSGNSIYQNGGISRHNFFNTLSSSRPPEFGNRQPEGEQALTEAWAWLQSAGLLVETVGSSGGWLFISRRATE